MEDILLKERDNIGTISQLLKLCQSLGLNPKSSFDPMHKVNIKLKFFTNGLQTLYNKHCAIYSEIMQNNSLQASMLIYQDTELLMAYETFYQSGIRLIFNSITTLFRSENESHFLQLFLQIYFHLKSCLKGVREQKSITHATRSFEVEFFHAFLKAHSNSYSGGNIKDILSFNTSLVQFPSIKSENIIQSHCIKLDSKRLGFRRLLVEVVELQSSELAFFKIESCNIIDAQRYTAENLMNELVMGQSNLLNFNKSLLFIPLKFKDMKILEYTNSGLKLETRIGNKIQLDITSENLLEWETTWKSIFQQYFSNGVEIRQKRKDSVSAASYANDTNIFDKQPHISKPQIPRNSSPIAVNTNDTSSSNLNYLERSKSVTEFENLSFEKLVELDNSIPIELSPLIRAVSPTKKVIKSVVDTFTIQQLDSTIPNEMEYNELESIISSIGNTHINDDDDDDGDDPHQSNGKEESVFNPRASVYKPKLTSKKSSSLLSLFSSNHNSDLESGQDTRFSSTISIPKESSSSIFGTIQHEEEAGVRSKYINGPSNGDLLDSLELFQDNSIKLSYWTSHNVWEIVGDKKLKLSIGINRLRNGTVILYAYNDTNRNQCYLVTKISPSWNCMRTTAQDIQVRFSKNDILNHSLSDEMDTFVMTLRYTDAEKLLTILQKCITNSFRKPLSNSRTQETLATTVSSCLNESIFSYGATSTSSGLSLDKCETQDNTKKISNYNDDTTDNNNNNRVQSHLLTCNIKSKYHSLENGKYWKFQDTGETAIYSQDLHTNSSIKNRIGAFFEFTPSPSSSTQETIAIKKITCRLNNIQRLKKTGIVLHDDNNEYHLLVFSNPIVTDHVYRSIHSML